MPRCIECSQVVENTWETFGENTVRLVKCPNCSKFTDSYVQKELFLVFVDVLLQRPQSYRHLIFNRWFFKKHGITRFLWVILFLWMILDILAMMLRHPLGLITSPIFHDAQNCQVMPNVKEALPLVISYFVMTCSAFTVFTWSMVFLIKIFTRLSIQHNQLTTTLLISNVGKLVYFLTLIWKFDVEIGIISSKLYTMVAHVAAIRALTNRSIWKCVCILLGSLVVEGLLRYLWSVIAPNLFIFHFI
eukprot:TRINITY_DN778119_c0_g1_i1.p1 TRINITY_DN778119_c0_g1~~TRINITY_DN778119_c0_g1_i1.p1  ORF type:complete len:246 (+),score=20.82 TRINITY_DN778119_c0_g1_i1:104-841(+)